MAFRARAHLAAEGLAMETLRGCTEVVMSVSEMEITY
jgi:hypothetical protein